MIFVEILIGFLVFIFVYKVIKRRKHLPPGPWGLPFIGNVLQLGSSPFLAHAEFAKRYGDIHSFSMFGHTAVVINSIAGIKDLKLSSSDMFNNRPVWLKTMCKSLDPGIAFNSVDEYLVNREFLLNNLKKRGMGKSGLEPQILGEADQLISYLATKSSLDPARVLGNYTSNNFMLMCFSKRWDYDDPEYETFHKSVARYLQISVTLMIGDMMPVLYYLPFMKRLYTECFKLIATIRDFYEKYINEKLNDEDTFEDFDIISDYLRIHKDFNDKERENLLDICQGLFVAGTDTTAATIGFALIHLIHHPEVQEELFDELETILQGRDPSMSDLQKLPLMEATMWEVLRMNPNAPLPVHATKEAAKFRSYTIPSNTLVLLNAYHINHDPEHFHDPTTFNPHRWLNSQGKFRSELIELTATFGMGKRVCPGRPLAKTEIFLLLVKLVQTFKLSVPDGHTKPDPSMKGAEIIMAPDPFILQVTRRTK